MDIMEVFDTLIYGKGYFRRANGWSGYVNVRYKLVNEYKELKETTFFFKYKGETVLIIHEEETEEPFKYKYSILYDGSEKHNFNKNINRTIGRIIDYLFLPYTDYRIIYG